MKRRALLITNDHLAEGVPGKLISSPLVLAAEASGYRRVQLYEEGFVAQVPTPGGYVWRGFTFAAPRQVRQYVEAWERGEPVGQMLVALR
jgi:hypothetical protein